MQKKNQNPKISCKNTCNAHYATVALIAHLAGAVGKVADAGSTLRRVQQAEKKHSQYSHGGF
jgi:hypothetical protein